MKAMLHALAGILIAAGVAAGSGRWQPRAQQPPAEQPRAEQPVVASLRVGGAGLKELKLELADLAAMPRRALTVKEKEGAEVKYEGVAVEQVLSKAGMAFGQALRGPRLRDFLLVGAGDGYAVVFALPELSEEFSDRVVIVADHADGKLIQGRDGPLRIIVSDEKKHARWVRNVVSLTVRTCTVEAAPTAPAPFPPAVPKP